MRVGRVPSTSRTKAKSQGGRGGTDLRKEDYSTRKDKSLLKKRTSNKSNIQYSGGRNLD
jgi:hypothetical protein